MLCIVAGNEYSLSPTDRVLLLTSFPTIASPLTLTEASGSGLMTALSHSGSQKRLNTTLSALNSVETMQKSVLNAFALKFSMLLPLTEYIG